MVTQNALRQYRKEIKHALKGAAAWKRSILENLDGDMGSYLEEHPDAGEAELRAYFGEPAAYAKEYAATMSGSELRSELDHMGFQKKLWLRVGIAIVLIIAILAVCIGIRNSQAAGDYHNHKVIEIVK